MANSQVGLTPLTISTPSLPSGTIAISVDTSVLPLVILADLNTVAINVTVGSTTTELAAFTVVGSQHQFVGSIPVGSTTALQIVEITGQNFTNGQNPSNPLTTATVQFQLIFSNSNLGTSITAPTGVTIAKGTTTCLVEWSIPQVTGFLGVRVQWSTDASGVTVPFQQVGQLSNGITRTAQVNLTPATKTVSTTPNPNTGSTPTNTVVTTKTVQSVTTTFDSMSIPQSTVNASVFFVILTTVVQDPTTNQMYESAAAGPFLAGFVNLATVNPTDMLALQTSNDIATRMVAQMNKRRPDLDLTARAEFRDVVTNVIALELATISTREWFARVCQSISALAQVDNQSGNGISDPVATSPVKQQIAQAFGLSQASVQAFISSRFDILGAEAGVPRGGSTSAQVFLTFFVLQKPTSNIIIPVNTVCSTTPNSTGSADTTGTTAQSFITTGSAVINAANAASFFIPSLGGWGVTVPAMAQTAGSAGNVGAETIDQIVSAGPTTSSVALATVTSAGGGQTTTTTPNVAGLNVINMNAADGGQDQQSNADYATVIQNTIVVGKDTGTRYGLWKTAMAIPGVSQTLVVAAGDLFMVRDWFPQIQAHIFGKVDIYVNGNTSSQQTQSVPNTFPPTSTFEAFSTYLTCTLLSLSNFSFKIAGFASLGSPIYTAVQMVATSAGRNVFLGVVNSQFDNVNGLIFLNPNDQPFTINTDGSTSPVQLNGVNISNSTFLQMLGTEQATFQLMAQLQAGISNVPTEQPVTAVNSITGPVTGAIPSSDIELVFTEDFLLLGNSNEADNTVVVSGQLTNPVQVTLNVTGTTTFISTDMDVVVDANGNPEGILSVLSSDLSTLFTLGVDYSIVAAGPYRSYALNILAGSAIVPGVSTQVVVAFNQFLLRETVTLQTDQITLTGTTPMPLSQQGFVDNSWLPANHGNTTLLLNGQSVNGAPPTGLIGAGVAPADRFILVQFNNGQNTITCINGPDFTLDITPGTGAVTIARVIGGQIPSGGTVSVTYFFVETLQIATEFPAFVEQVSTAINKMRAAGADIVIKAMVQNAIDLQFNVVLKPNATIESVDGPLRTQCALAIQAAQATQTQAMRTVTFSQSSLIALLQSVPGVQSIDLPLEKCARADGSYDIGVVIPTGTTWLPLSGDVSFSGLSLPPNSFISQAQLLPDPTIPSGGTPEQFVGFSIESQEFRRALSVQDFLTSTTNSFYFIGTDDEINADLPLPNTESQKILICTPGSTANPSLNSYFATYAVFGASSSDDITVVAPEVLVPGSIGIFYTTAS
jgi:hypothetical protein